MALAFLLSPTNRAFAISMPFANSALSVPADQIVVYGSALDDKDPMAGVRVSVACDSQVILSATSLPDGTFRSTASLSAVSSCVINVCDDRWTGGFSEASDSRTWSGVRGRCSDPNRQANSLARTELLNQGCWRQWVQSTSRTCPMRQPPIVAYYVLLYFLRPAASRLAESRMPGMDVAANCPPCPRSPNEARVIERTVEIAACPYPGAVRVLLMRSDASTDDGRRSASEVDPAFESAIARSRSEAGERVLMC